MSAVRNGVAVKDLWLARIPVPTQKTHSHTEYIQLKTTIRRRLWRSVVPLESILHRWEDVVAEDKEKEEEEKLIRYCGGVVRN